MIDTTGKLYLGRYFDLEKNLDTAEPVLYDPSDLTTHAVVIGMTGSGKTGLCLGMLEEAALNKIPAFMIDPKGDIANSLLVFPDFLPENFKPWVNADEARRSGKTVDQAAAEAAASWKKGLESWEITPDRMRALQDAVDIAVYTPGSDAGIPVSILASLKAPEIPFNENREILREKLTSTVTAILGLLGMQNIDPLRSREHILLSNIFENAWVQGHDLTLSDLILQAQNPPFSKLGVFEVNQFYPEKDRFELAMLLNNILASPGFQSWVDGVPLDVESLMYTPEGKPRHCIFYIAHLGEAEQMFFVTLLYSAVDAWMRTKGGTPVLRALLYFDEVFGFIPPTANPPSKIPILRMLKQARAFGVGLVLVTQNPVDLDYKGLSNTGTWFIGKLQTERDKMRLLDGLEGASGGGLDRAAFDSLISKLGKRRFLLHNVHEPKPRVFQTRWVMSYMAGPLTRSQLPLLKGLRGQPLDTAAASPVTYTATGAPSTPAARPAAPTASSQQPNLGNMQPVAMPMGSKSKPTIPAKIDEYFLPHTLTISQAARAAGRSLPSDVRMVEVIYRPAVLAQVTVRFVNRVYDLNMDQTWTALAETLERSGVVRWEDYSVRAINPRELDRTPVPDASFAQLEPPFNQAAILTSLKTDYMDWVYRGATAKVRTNQELKVYAGPDVSQADFRKMCADAARLSREADIEKRHKPLEKRIQTLQDRLEREEREVDQEKDELSQRRMEEYGTHAENLLGLLGGRKRRLTTSLTKRRMTAKTKADLEESEDSIKSMKKELQELEAERTKLLEEIQAHWSEVVDNVEEIAVQPLKKDVLLDLFGLAWFPYMQVESSAGRFELPGYEVARITG